MAGNPVINSVSPPKGSMCIPSWASKSRCSRAAAASPGRKVHRLRHQQRLRLAAAGRQPRAQVLVKDPLVQGVLVDDRHAVLGFGHQVAVVDL